MKLILHPKQVILYLIWILVFILSCFLFLNSLYFIPSLILFICIIITSVMGFVIALKTQQVYLFSPILQTLYCIVFYIGLSGLFYFSSFNKIHFLTVATPNDKLLTDIALLYLAFILSIFFPCWFKKIIPNINLTKYSLFRFNFDNTKLIKILKLSQVLLLILFLLLFITTSNTPLSAILNPSQFRQDYTHGIALWIYSIFSPLLWLHLTLILKITIINKIFYKNFIIFTVFYLLWSILSGARSWFLLPLMFSVYFFFLKKKLNINILKVLLTFSVFLLMLVTVAFYNTFRNHPLSVYSFNGNLNSYETNIIESSLERIDYFSNSVKYFKYIDFKYGSIWSYDDYKISKQLISPFLIFIPRSVYSNKGYITSGELTLLVFDKSLVKEKGITYLFGGISNFFYTAGFLGVIFFGLLYGLLITLLETNSKELLKYDSFQIIYVFLLLDVIIQYFSHGILNVLPIPLLIKIAILLIFLFYMYKRKRIEL